MNIFDIALIETGLSKDKFTGIESSSYGGSEYWEKKLYWDIEDLKTSGEYIRGYRNHLFDDCSWNKLSVNDFIFDLDIDESEELTLQIVSELGKELELNRDLTMFQIMINVNKDNGTWNLEHNLSCRLKRIGSHFE